MLSPISCRCGKFKRWQRYGISRRGNKIGFTRNKPGNLGNSGRLRLDSRDRKRRISEPNLSLGAKPVARSSESEWSGSHFGAGHAREMLEFAEGTSHRRPAPVGIGPGMPPYFPPRSTKTQKGVRWASQRTSKEKSPPQRNRGGAVTRRLGPRSTASSTVAGDFGRPPRSRPQFAASGRVIWRTDPIPRPPPLTMRNPRNRAGERERTLGGASSWLSRSFLFSIMTVLTVVYRRRAAIPFLNYKCDNDCQNPPKIAFLVIPT